MSLRISMTNGKHLHFVISLNPKPSSAIPSKLKPSQPYSTGTLLTPEIYEDSKTSLGILCGIAVDYLENFSFW